ncbi:unnamed protein product [Candida verbasci]|uniref:AB hydrolase-1 domain-containing protein n=1 Tax=Candida verbasci TaxID=1227364 RepID=A0A9W4TX85_9ASCO|nr:unnamed protein product [Candida verbasci]
MNRLVRTSFRFLATKSPNLGTIPNSYAHSDPSFQGDSLSDNIETVKLEYDKFSPEPSTKKSPVVILHGLFGSKTNNRTIAKQLSHSLDRDIFCLDLRNFGSSPHINRLDYPSLSADVESWIQEQSFENKPILVGHSMGAKTVMALALRKPSIPKMVVSIDNAPIEGNSDIKFIKYINQLRLSIEKYHYSNIKDVDAKLAEIESDKSIRQFILTNLNRGKKHEHITSKIPLDIIQKALRDGMISSWPYDSKYVKYNGPTLFIRGSESPYVPDESLPAISQFFPNFEIRDIKCGHWVTAEKPKEFMETLIEFIERKEDE